MAVPDVCGPCHECNPLCRACSARLRACPLCALAHTLWFDSGRAGVATEQAGDISPIPRALLPPCLQQEQPQILPKLLSAPGERAGSTYSTCRSDSSWLLHHPSVTHVQLSPARERPESCRGAHCDSSWLCKLHITPRGGKLACRAMNGCRPFACVGTQPGVDSHLGPEEQHNPRPNTITGPRDVCKACEELLPRL